MKKLCLRVMRTLLFILVPLLLVIWLVIAQPSFQSNSRSQHSVAPEELRQHVKYLAEDCFPRNFLNHDKLEKSVLYIAAEFAESGGVVEIQPFMVKGHEYKNVSVIFGEGKGDTLIVGAHYDSFESTPGADDNASGVAGLIELAKMIGGSDLAKHNIELVAYCLEEPPYFGTHHMGSFAHASAINVQERGVKGVIILEMIGYFDDAWMSQDYPLPLLYLMYPKRGDFITVVGEFGQREFTKKVKLGMKGSTDLPVYSINAPTAVPGIDFSDHRNYWHFHHHAVMITDTAFYRNKQYHKAGDNVELLDYKKMSDVVVAVFASIEKLLAE